MRWIYMFKFLRRPWLILVSLIGLALFLVPAIALAQTPAPPHLFLGHEGAVTRGPENEPVGSGTIFAWVDGKNVASGAVTNGAYQLQVEEPSGYSFSSKVVTFTVDGSSTDANGIWRKGGADVLSLKVMADSYGTSGPSTSGSDGSGFRENPTTRLRPVQDRITSDQDGIIEVFIVNPSVNEVTISVDIVIAVPSGVHVYGEGFACGATGAGACSGSFTILPAQSKTVVVNIKSDKIGSHIVHFSGYWWPGEDRDMRQPISLTHPFEVVSPSASASPTKELAAMTPTDPAPAESSASTPMNARPNDTSDKGVGGCQLSSGGSIPLGSLSLALSVGLMGFRGMFGGLL